MRLNGLVVLVGIWGSSGCDGSAVVHSLQLAIMSSMALVMPSQKYNWRASGNVFDLPVCCKCRLESTVRRAATGTTIHPWNVRNIPWTDIPFHWALYWCAGWCLCRVLSNFSSYFLLRTVMQKIS